ncbi:hypothetical protein A3K86_21380 [Photobacterium jeanii]|uniref:Uncharacterized protein n=1 Tax=Photobacterium jeanii TaxID=858640 RepID=A0A178K2E5_9GAMM|nr:hypothetical protein [Photobacterium jeanii]OAN11488.1 hypothetical protein A3K86_21380 [Photobacterium jeanii]PST91009.1 hypothetical protein C9I91_10485 [Photobacterium jeanii]
MEKTQQEAPLWVLPLAILVVLMVQFTANIEDASQQKINTLHGETLQLWQSLEEEGHFSSTMQS